MRNYLREGAMALADQSYMAGMRAFSGAGGPATRGRSTLAQAFFDSHDALRSYSRMSTRNFGMTTGAVAGGMYGAVSNDTSVIGGALMGAGIGRGIGYGVHGANIYRGSAAAMKSPGYLNSIGGAGVYAARSARNDASRAWKYIGNNYTKPFSTIKQTYGEIKTELGAGWKAAGTQI